MTAAITIITTKDEPRADSRELAGRLKNHHKNVMDLIERYADSFKRFGHLPFQTANGERRQGGGRAQRFALLNENQAFFLLSLARNSDHVVGLKADLIQAFSDARTAASARVTEYRPTYRALHDRVAELAAGSPNARWAHVNVNSAINKVVGIEAGQRRTLAAPKLALTITAQTVATAAMSGAQNHKDGYARMAVAMGRLQDALAVLDGPDVAVLEGGRHGERA
ncbi:MAG: Rha family transcriptional regulator [Hydrogenophaga sp.]|nr:Rha family transcriptional regulator [Hydrogenophaga sp.]